MTANGYLQLVFYIVVLLALAKPLGTYMANIYEGKPGLLSRIGAPFERLIYRVSGVDASKEMGWVQYAVALLLFNLLGALMVYGLQRLQANLPLNPAKHGCGFARLFVQHGGQLRHQHQLAGLRRRDAP